MVVSRERWALDLGLTAVAMGPIRPGGTVRSPTRDAFVFLPHDGSSYRPLTTLAQEGTELNTLAATLAAKRRMGSGREVILRAQLGFRPELLRYDLVNPLFSSGPPEFADSALRPMSRAMVSTSWIGRSATAWYRRYEVQLSWQRLYERRQEQRLSSQCFGELDESSAAMCAGSQRLVPDDVRLEESNASDALGLATSVQLGRAESAVRALLGADVVHDVVSASAEQFDRASGARSSVPARFPDGATDTRAGVFAMSRYRLLPTLWAELGGRGALFALRIPERPELSPAQELWFADWAANAGLSWHPAAAFQSFVNVGRALRAPNVQDLSTLGVRARGRYQIPNPRLGAEHSLGADWGVRLKSSRLQITNTVFWLRQSNAIVLGPADVDATSLGIDAEQLIISRNASAVEIWGTEGSWSFRWLDDWSFFGRWLALLGTQNNPPELGLPDSTPADRIPPHQLDAGIHWEATPRLDLEVFMAGRRKQQRLNDPINVTDNRIPAGGLQVSSRCTPARAITYQGRCSSEQTSTI